MLIRAVEHRAGGEVNCMGVASLPGPTVPRLFIPCKTSNKGQWGLEWRLVMSVGQWGLEWRQD